MQSPPINLALVWPAAPVSPYICQLVNLAAVLPGKVGAPGRLHGNRVCQPPRIIVCVCVFVRDALSAVEAAVCGGSVPLHWARSNTVNKPSGRPMGRHAAASARALSITSPTHALPTPLCVCVCVCVLHPRRVEHEVLEDTQQRRHHLTWFQCVCVVVGGRSADRHTLVMADSLGLPRDRHNGSSARVHKCTSTCIVSLGKPNNKGFLVHAPPTTVPQPSSRQADTTARAISSPPGSGGGVTNSFTLLVLAPLLVLFLMKRNPPPLPLDPIVLSCRCSFLSEEDVGTAAEGRGEERRRCPGTGGQREK